MKKGYIKLLTINFLLILFLALNIFLNVLNTYTIILFLSIVLALVFYTLGYEKDKSRYKKDVILMIAIYGISYTIITNIIGIFIGFNRNPYSLTILPVLKNILPLTCIIILLELIRYIIITKGSKYKTIYILVVIVFILFDVTININNYKVTTLEGVINFITTVVLASISKNIMLTYITNKVGFKPAILYRIVFEIPIYFLPIFPNFGDYLESVLEIMAPIIFMYIVYNNFEKIKNIKIITRKLRFNYETVIVVGIGVVVAAIILLSSGLLKYYFLTIGSESMTGAINKGDIIVVEKLNKKEINSLQEGDILVFKHSKRIIVHRIVRILNEKGNNYFYTKGDYNEAEDGYPIEEKDIIGTTIFKIPYLGYPTIILNELIKSVR